MIHPAQHILMHADNSQHVTMLTAGQLELNNYVNTEAKYTNLRTQAALASPSNGGRFGLKHAACDSMLLLAEGITTSAGVVNARRCGWMRTTSIHAGHPGMMSMSKPGKNSLWRVARASAPH